jgi:ferrous iron transport protein A
MTVADLKEGEKGKIASFQDTKLALKLLEMGCLPGTVIKLDHKAPLGCPYCITVGDNYHFLTTLQVSVKKSEIFRA